MVLSSRKKRKGNRGQKRERRDRGFNAGLYYICGRGRSPDFVVRQGDDGHAELIGKWTSNSFFLDSTGNFALIGKDCCNYLKIDRNDVVKGRARITTNIKEHEPLLEEYYKAKFGRLGGSRVRVRGADGITRELEIIFFPAASPEQHFLKGVVTEVRGSGKTADP